MDIDIKLRNLRVKLRQNSREIMNDVLERHVPRISSKDKPKNEICVFCANKDNLTKEHVLPRWTFENCTKKFFVTGINGSEQTYNKTTIPVCADCNNNLLGSIESYIISILNNIYLSSSFFSDKQSQDIIRWLEIIEYNPLGVIILSKINWLDIGQDTEIQYLEVAKQTNIHDKYS